MWPSIRTIDGFLGEEDLAIIRKGLVEANYQDGAVSAGGGNLLVKNNLEMASDQQYVDLVKIVENAVRSSIELNTTVFPRAITRTIFSRYDEGMAYGTHVDSAVIGFLKQANAFGPFGQNYLRTDFSMTIFLAEPDTYGGGELSFGSPWGAREYKLLPGSAVFYPTGIPHEVKPVTYGTRLAAVLWLQSMVHDPEQRQLISDQFRLAEILLTKDPDSQEAQMARDIASTALRLAADV
jgi:PKHD-type hydroxylase